MGITRCEMGCFQPVYNIPLPLKGFTDPSAGITL
jgi:hypothetical protein